MAWLVSKAQWFWSNRPDLQFGWVVLMLCGYLFWEAWEKRPSPLFNGAFQAAVMAGLAMTLLFLVQIYQAAFGTTAATVAGLALGLLLVVAANLRYVFGWAGVRHFALPFAFILVALPLPSLIYNPVVHGLQSKVATLNVEMLGLLGVPATRVGSLIQLPRCTVGIDEACSGIRSLQSTLMSTIFIGHLVLSRRHFKLLLVAVGIGIAILGNVIRSLLLSMAANNSGAGALDQFHDAAGWSILVFTLVGVILAAWLLAKVEKHIQASDAARTEMPRQQPG